MKKPMQPPRHSQTDPKRMSKSELSDRLNALQNSSGDLLSEVREKELQTVLHELEVYQIELEMQVRELTESRQELEESHNRYANLYDFAPVGYVTLTEEGTIKEVNLTTASLLGVERRWLIERSLSPWVMGSDLPIFRSHLRNCRTTEGTVKSTLRLMNRSKQIIPVEFSTSIYKDIETGRTLMRTAITDLTDRRSAEADLDRFFNLSADILCILENTGRYIRVNPTCENILGYAPAEMVGRSAMEFIHPDDREAAIVELGRIKTDGVITPNFQSRHIKKDRSAIWVSWSSMSTGGKIYAVGRDITSQVLAKSELESVVEKLREERSLRERFVSALTHDLRTPLTAARVCAQLLERIPTIEDSVLKLSHRIILGIDRADHMIQDLLDANRIRAGEELPIERSEFDLTQLVQNTLEELSAIHGKRFKIEEKGPTRGRWSEDSLRRVIENLVNNAVKYGDRKKSITISVLKDKSKDQVILSVRNFGNPIPIEEQPTLFRQFRRSAYANKSGKKGWGIGLSLVRGIVEAHGGEIDVESSAKAGTLFRVVLPLGSG